MKYLIFIVTFGFCNISLADDSIECTFEKALISNNKAGSIISNPIKKSLTIFNLKSKAPLSNEEIVSYSKSWVKLGAGKYESTVTSYVGEAGEMLVLEHEFGENLKGLKGWHSTTFVTSNVETTYTALGKCLVK